MVALRVSRLHLQLKFTFCDSFPFKVKTVSAMAFESHAVLDITRVVRQYLLLLKTRAKRALIIQKCYQTYTRVHLTLREQIYAFLL